ncbi:hypothetical protein EBZ80_05215 [bacterium]|nr:hypothetical protein [bacterium]
MSRLPSKCNQDGPFGLPVRRARESLPWRGIAISWLRRSRHGLPEAATSLVALAVFGSLFIHVFRDIFSPEIAALAPGVTAGATAVACAVIVAAGILLVRKMVREDSTLGWVAFCGMLGSKSEHTDITGKIIDQLIAIATGVATAAIARVAARNIIADQPPGFEALATLAIITACVVTATRTRNNSGTGTGRASRDSDFTPSPGRLSFSLVAPRGAKSRLATMVRWRTGLLLRAPLTWWFWGASGMAFAGMAVAASGSVAKPFVAVFAWLAGWLAALPLAIEAASGNASSHFEFSLGITPAQVARSHAGSGVMVSLMTATIAALTTTICGRGDSTLVAIAAAAMAPSLMPALLWQIDVRRPLVQWMTSLMASLFLATAIIATKAAFLLWPVVLVFLVQQQNKRLEAGIPFEVR